MKELGFKKLGSKTSLVKRNNDLTTGGWTYIDSLKSGLVGIPYGYTPLSKCPEVLMAVDRIADLVSNMTIHLMENTDNGDKRVINGLSNKIDINPCRYLTRKSWIKVIVRTLLLEGDGNAIVLPVYSKNGDSNYIDNLIPVPAKNVQFKLGDTFLDGYRIIINQREFDPEDLIHFVYNPDPTKIWIGRGYSIPLKTIQNTLNSAQGVKKQFMDGRYMPSIIIKVDADTDDFESMEGRESILDRYISAEKAGQPWIIPTDLFDVQQVTPLSLKDIAVTDTIAQDKKTIAALMGVPSFFLGEGNFNTAEYNNFIKDKILSIAKVIEQTLTKSLIYGENWYFKFNIRSLYAHDLNMLKEVGASLYNRGIMTGNEVRDLIGLSPIEGLNDLIILENYINKEDIGKQSKLEKEVGNGEENTT